MSKKKTKLARREMKRTAQKKATNFAKAAHKPTGISKPTASKPTTSSKPTPQKAKALASAATETADTHAPTEARVQASQKPEVPFGVYDNILLVGEGDFSFTRSLAIEHGCANVVGTSYDSEAAVREKYPSFSSIHADLSALTPPVPLHHSIDATKLSSYKTLRPEGETDTHAADDDDAEYAHSWDTICFQFPHTGGLSTDVNRQVRANQALLSAFLHSCLEKTLPVEKPTSVAAPAHRPAPHPESARALNANLAPLGPSRLDAAGKGAGKGKNKRARLARSPFLKPGGRVIVTLFESEPYTLWNVRDLARHAGFRVVTSFSFPWAAYPGYSHVRTLGAIEGGGGWKGEDRGARMYIFEKPESDGSSSAGLKKKKGERQGNVGKVMGETWRSHRELEEVGSGSDDD